MKIHLWILFAAIIGAAPVVHAEEEGPCLPGVFDPAKGIGAGECYTKEEMTKALGVMNQPIVIQGNRGGTKKWHANFFTLNPETRQGMNIEMNAPLEPGPRGMKAYKATRAYTRALYRDAVILDANKAGGAMQYAAQYGGELGETLKRGERNGYYLALKAESGNKPVFISIDRKNVGTFYTSTPANPFLVLAVMADTVQSDYGLSLVRTTAFVP